MRKMRASHSATVYFKAIIFNLLVQLVATIVLIAVGASGKNTAGTENILQFVFMIAIQLGFLLAVLTTVKGKKRGLAIGFKKVSAKDILLSVLATVVCIFSFSLVAEWFAFFLKKIGFTSAGLSFSSPVEIILGILSAGLLAPVIEELVFRGALLGGLIKKQKPQLAIIISSLAFSLMHMNPEQTVYQFFLGALAGIVALKSGSIIPAITVHATNNIIALVLSFIPATGESSLSPSWAFFAITVGAVIIAVALIFALVHFMGKKGEGKQLIESLLKEEETDLFEERELIQEGALLGKRAHTILVSIGIGICALMWFIVLGSSLIL